MKFKNYDLLSHLISGYLVYQMIYFLYEGILPKIEIIPSIAIAYIIGYFINSLSSWLERIYFFTYGGKPSNNLLAGRDIKKVRFYESKKVAALLKGECSAEEPVLDEMFSIALMKANSEDNPRIEDFNSSYALSRTILTSVLIISPLVLIEFYDNLITYIVLLPMIYISWQRTKERGYYFAREVLFTYLNTKE